MRDKIKDVILGYCEGISHLEFSINDLDDMVTDIMEVSKRPSIILEPKIKISRPSEVGSPESLTEHIIKNVEEKIKTNNEPIKHFKILGDADEKTLGEVKTFYVNNGWKTFLCETKKRKTLNKFTQETEENTFIHFYMRGY